MYSSECITVAKYTHIIFLIGGGYGEIGDGVLSRG